MESIPVAEHEDPAWAAFDAIDAAVTVLFESDATRRSTVQQAEFLRRIERVANRLPALGHREITALRRTATAAELGNTLQRALADLLRISPGEAKRRVADAEQLGPRTALSGEPMEPWLAHTAKAQSQGAIGGEHVKVIRKFFKKLPAHIHQPARDAAEQSLVAYARGVRPDELRGFANDLRQRLDQDGDFKDDTRARRRGMTVGPPDEDGMRRVTGWLDPEAGATWDAVNASWAAPGMCNPADESPCIDEPTAEAAERDGRSQRQRNHDAYKAVGRAILMSGKLGVHKGLPATIIVSTTLAELEAKAGVARTAGGTLLPMKDLLRLARHAVHYLAIYGDKGEILHLGRTKRTANAAQRIVLHDRDRGCTRPGCTVPGYGAEAHHATLDWAVGGLTNVDDLAFACPRDNKLVKKGGWQTRKNIFGETEWIPPPHLDTGQPRVNTYHHPERLRGQFDTGAPPGESEPPE
jgi:hypothetical protein